MTLRGEWLDVLCVGETMGVVTPAYPESLSEAKECLLGIGGAESNVAGHLAEFGYRTAWASRVGVDSFGTRIVESLASRGVDIGRVVQDSSAPTGVYFKDPDMGSGAATLYYRSSSAASRMGILDSGTWGLEETRWVHASGITPALSATCSELIERLLAGAGDRGYQVSFDVNFRPALWEAQVAGPQLMDMANRAAIVFVGLDEAEVLWGARTAGEVSAVLPGPRHLIVKDSAHEAVEFIRAADGAETIVRVSANKVDVVEPVGAGDAFAAGYLAGFLRNDSPADRLALGHSFAAWTLGSREDFRPGHGTTVRSFQTST